MNEGKTHILLMVEHGDIVIIETDTSRQDGYELKQATLQQEEEGFGCVCVRKSLVAAAAGRPETKDKWMRREKEPGREEEEKECGNESQVKNKTNNE